MNWHTLAACRNTPDPELFFPVDATCAATRPAKAVCRRCPVLAECRTWALTHEAYGIWGGLDEHERTNLRRNLAGRSTLQRQA